MVAAWREHLSGAAAISLRSCDGQLRRAGSWHSRSGTRQRPDEDTDSAPVQDELIIFSLFLVFVGASVLAGLALYARQSLLVAYIAVGGLLGPWGFKLVSDPSTIQQIGHVGIIFLLFLLGLNLPFQQLLRMLREATAVTVGSSCAFAVLGGAVALAFGYTATESAVIGAVMMFSSTIIGLKLLPTTALHHRHLGQVIVSILLLQDVIAIVMLLLIGGASHAGGEAESMALPILGLPVLVGFAFVFERYALTHLLQRFDTIQEFLFLVSIGWCLGMAQAAQALGLSYEIGAFVGGVAMGAHPIARFIAENLRPLRDFFLIMFFFSLGASFELPALPQVLLPATVLALLMMVAKPVVFRILLMRAGESPQLSWEIGVRLGQISEFALLIAVVAVKASVIGKPSSYLIQTATLISFIVSSYVTMLRFPTPIAVNERLRRD